MTFFNKIKNPQTTPPEKSKFNDNEILRTAVATEKKLCTSCTTAMFEASHEKLYKLLFDILKDTSQQHRKLVELQFHHGWYSLTPAPTEEIKALEQEFKSAKQQ